jgi:RNA polymerase sigma-70 factor (ECF subfamily)
MTVLALAFPPRPSAILVVLASGVRLRDRAGPPSGRCDAARTTQGLRVWCPGDLMELGGEPAAREHGGDPAALLEALRAGDDSAFLVLVNRHHASMVRVATLYVGSRAEAEEVAQEAWVGVLKGLHLFEGRSSLQSWIFRILVNCAKARGIRESRSVPLSSLASGDEEEAAVPAERFQDHGVWTGHWSQPPSVWSDEQVASAELATLAREGIEELPPSQREVMTLRDVEGWESHEVCELLEISEANQRVLLHRARSKVRAYVEERRGKEVRP